VSTVGIVRALITADVAGLKKGLNQAQGSLDQFSSKAKAAGKAMTMKVTAPIVGAGVAAAKMAGDFEFSMTQIESLVGRSAKEVEQLKANVLGLAGETGRAPKELADAMFFITSAGLDAEAATAALEMSAKAAAIGMGETVVVADAVTNAMNSYGMSADQAAFATDVLAKTVEQGKASAEELAPQIGRLTPMAAELGIGFDQVGGALAFLTRRSGDASQSTTGLMGAMKSLLKPSTGARDLMDDIGFSLEDFRAVAEKDFLGAMRQMRDALEANGHEMSAVIEDVTGMNAAVMMTGDNMDEARGIMDEMTTALGKTDEAFTIVSKTANFKMSTAMADLKAAFITIGEKLLPVIIPLVQKLADWISELAEAFGNLSPTMQKVVIAFTGLVAAAGPLLLIAGSLAGALAKLGVAAGTAGAAKGASALAGSVGTKAGGLGKLLPALISPVGLLTTAVGVGLFMAWKSSAEEARKARERQEELTAAFAAEGDEATLLVSRVDSLIERHKALSESTIEATADIEEFTGKSTMLGYALEKEVAGAFEDLALTSDELSEAVSGGTDEFQRLEEMTRFTITTDRELIKALKNTDDEINHVTSALAEQFAQGKINRDELENMLDVLDETADAYDDHREKLNEDAKAVLENTEKQKEFADILGGKVVESIVKAADESGEWADRLEYLEGRIERTVEESERLEHVLNMSADAQRDVWRQGQTWVDVLDPLITDVESLADAVEETVEEIRDLNGVSTDLTDILENEGYGVQGVDSGLKSLMDKYKAAATLGGSLRAGVFANTEEYKDFMRALKLAEEAEKNLTDTEKGLTETSDNLSSATGRSTIRTLDAWDAVVNLERAQERLQGVEQKRLDLSEDIESAQSRLITLASQQDYWQNIIADNDETAIEQGDRLRDINKEIIKLAEDLADDQVALQGTALDLTIAQKNLEEAQIDVTNSTGDLDAAMALLDNNMADYGAGFMEAAGMADVLAMAVSGVSDSFSILDAGKSTLNTLRQSERGGIASELDLSPSSLDWFQNAETIMHFQQNNMMDLFRLAKSQGNVGMLDDVIHMGQGSGRFAGQDPMSASEIRNIYNITVEGSVIKESDLFNATIGHIQEKEQSFGPQTGAGAGIGSLVDFGE